MIQRIQSVYLLVVTILLIVCMCTPVGAYIAEDYSVSKFTNLCIVPIFICRTNRCVFLFFAV